MARRLPSNLAGALGDARESLRKSLHVVGRLNRAEDRPIPEQNLVLHLGAALLERGHAIYGEADLPGRGRIDLLACKGKSGVVAEAATFGAIDMAKVLNDARRLQAYKPQGTWKLVNRRRTDAFWTGLQDRWAVLVVLCFSEPHLAKCWKSLLNAKTLETSLECADVREIRAFGKGRRAEMRQFGDFLRAQDACVGADPVIEQDTPLWVDVMPLWLLWAGWRLS